MKNVIVLLLVASIASAEVFLEGAMVGQTMCGILANNSLVCYGLDTYPQIQLRQISAGSDRYCGLTMDNQAACWQPYGGSDTVPSGTTFTKVVAGSNYGCGLLPGGTVQCWGSNANLLDVPTGINTDIDAGSPWVCVVRSDTTIQCKYFRIPSGSMATPVDSGYKQISVTSTIGCAVKTTGQVSCWSEYSSVSGPNGGYLFDEVVTTPGVACGIVLPNRNVLCWSTSTGAVYPSPAATGATSLGRQFTASQICAAYPDRLVCGSVYDFAAAYHKSNAYGECGYTYSGCSCYSGFSGPACDIRPSASCSSSYNQVDYVSANFDPLLKFYTNNSMLNFEVTSSLEDSKYLFPATNDTLTSNDTYSLATYISIGNTGYCDYPQSGGWSKDVVGCKDRWSSQVYWSNAIYNCGFDDSDGDYTFTSVMKISRYYQLPNSLTKVQTLQKTLSFIFPQNVEVSSNVTVDSGAIKVYMTSLSYSPYTDYWTMIFRLTSSIKVQSATALFGRTINNTILSDLDDCSSGYCNQQLNLTIAGCNALNGTMILTFQQVCSGTCPAAVNVSVALKTGDSCAVANTIHFNSTSFKSYSSPALNQLQTMFTPKQTIYFGASLQTTEYDTNSLEFTVKGVCVGTSPCVSVPYNTFPVYGTGMQAGISVDLTPLNLAGSTAVFKATIGVSAYTRKRDVAPSAILNFDSVVSITQDTQATTGISQEEPVSAAICTAFSSLFMLVLLVLNIL